MPPLSTPLNPQQDLALPDLASANLSSSLDPTGIDQRLQALNGVTSTWAYPQLPDTVKLDLVTSNLLPDTNALTGFTNGVAADLTQAQTPEPVRLPAQTEQTRLSALFYPEDDPVTRLRQVFSDLAGKPPPSVISDQAVVKIKQRGIASGLLTPDTPLDGSWSSGLNSVKYQLAQEDFKDRLQGERTGAIKASKMVGLIDKWTSPTGLLTAATALGFVPDFQKIASETQNWGAKISDWWHNHRSNPLKMIQALSGPIDDIVFPVLNDALLLSGVGNVVTFSRFARLGQLASRASQLGDLASAGRFLTLGGDIVTEASGVQKLFGLAINEAHAAAEIGRMTAPSILASRLGSSSRALPQLAAKGMEAWRGATSTVIAKKAIQQGMKLGLISNVEHAISGTEMKPVFDFKAWAYGKHANPLTSAVASFGEVALTPSSILNHGAFTDPIKDGASLLKRRLTGLTTDQFLGTAFYKVAQDFVKYRDPAKYQSLMEAVSNVGRRSEMTKQQVGLMHLLGTDSPEEAGQRMLGVVLSKSLDKWAKLKTLETGIDQYSNPDEWRQTYHVFRNRAINQIRDLSDVDLATDRGRAMYASMRSHVAAADRLGADVEQTRAQFFRDILHSLDTPEGQAAAKADLAKHSDVRRGVWNEVAGTLDESDLYDALSEHWDNLSHWHEYTTALDKVRTLDPREVSIFDVPDSVKQMWEWSDLGESLSTYKQVDRASLDNAWVNDMAVQLDEGRGRVALAKLDTPTRQDAEVLQAHVENLLGQLAGADAHSRMSIREQLDELNASDIWGKLKVEDEYQFIEDKVRRLDEVKRWVAKGVEVPDDLKAELHGMGYKPVFGVEFAFPHDVLDLMGPVPYVSNSTQRKYSLGLFFGRDNQAHDLLNGLRKERFTNIVNAEMQRIHGVEADGESLYAMLKKGRIDMVDAAAKDAAQTELLSLTGRIGARIKNASMPFSTFRLSEHQISTILGGRYSADEVKTIKAALVKAENVGFDYLGLQKFENELVSNSWLRGALKAFSASPASDGLGPVDRLRQSPGSWGSWWKSARQVVGLGEGDLSGGRRLVGAAVLGTAAAAQSGDLKQGALAAGAGAAFPRIVSPKLVARLLLAQGVRTAANRLGADDTTSNLLGLAAPFGAMPLAGKILSNPAWGQYSRLADRARYYRDLYRFSLSPIWDIQRYTEGAVMNATNELGIVNGKRVTLPVTLRPMRRAMEDTGLAKDEIVRNFQKASRPFFEYEAVDSAQKWFHEIGIAGFSPTEWMAATHAQLVRQGYKTEEAASKVMQIYTYGLTGRSAAELSANFVFFPFSFQKKYLGNMAKFLSQDLGRTVLLHDAMKMYSDLWEHYDVSRQLQDHVPIMAQMRKINALAFGISPGELGGINRPIYEMAHRLPVLNDVHDAIVNSFLPQALKIDTQSGWREIQPHVKRMLPVWRDIEDIHGDLVEQKNVITSPTHQVSARAAEAGWEEWRKINDNINSYANALGTTYGSILYGDKYQYVKNQIQRQRLAVQEKYPEFVASRQKASERAVQKDQEIRRITLDPSGPDELAMRDFIGMVDGYRQVLSNVGVDLNREIEAVPTFVLDSLRRRAVEVSAQVPGFARLYRIYYSGLFGPIEYQVR